MNQLFRIELIGEIPEGDHDMGAHAHVAAVGPVTALVKTLTDMGVINVTKHIRVLRQKAAPPAAKAEISAPHTVITPGVKPDIQLAAVPPNAA